MMRCIHCGGIDGGHHELCGGDDTQPPSEGMTLAQIIDKQVARIATQEAEINRLQTEQVEMQRKLSNSNSIVDTQAAEMAQYEKACKQFEKTVEDGEATIKALREQWNEFTNKHNELMAAYYVRGEENIRLREQLARMPVCVGYVVESDIAFLHKPAPDFKLPGVRKTRTPIFKHPIYIDPAPQEKQG